MSPKYFISTITFVLIFHNNHFGSSLKFDVPQNVRENENEHWYSLAKDDIEFAIKRKFNNNIAKNVIIFLGDGMGVTMTTAGRIFKGQKDGYSGEEGFLAWEKFPSVGFSKTYNIDKQVPDSAATATAFFGGVKGNYRTLGVTGSVKCGDCKASLKDTNRVRSILQWSQDAGKDTGIVTSTRVTHATPAALYAHSAHRDWECDQTMINQTEFNVDGCKDIARQLIEDEPGKRLNVILAGGRQNMGAGLPDDKVECVRKDKRNLVEEWLVDKKKSGMTAEYVTNNMELDKLNPQDRDFIMGLFAGSHIPYAYEKKKGPDGTPTLKKLTEVAIKRLKRNKDGFFLMVEGGRIDHGLHDSRPHAAMLELLEFEEAVQTALEMTNDEDTLIIVTADHSHVMTINGYPDRGNDILGTTSYENAIDNLPYTTLMFTNGFGGNYSWDGEKVVRANLTGVDTRDLYFISQSAVKTKAGAETHGGEDVGIFANGPMSHLFYRVHEQSYIAHVMGFASCVGPYKRNCERPTIISIEEAYETAPTHGNPIDNQRSAAFKVVPVFSVWMVLIINIMR